MVEKRATLPQFKVQRNQARNHTGRCIADWLESCVVAPKPGRRIICTSDGNRIAGVWQSGLLRFPGDLRAYSTVDKGKADGGRGSPALFL
jgi:hypothetical protein